MDIFRFLSGHSSGHDHLRRGPSAPQNRIDKSGLSQPGQPAPYRPSTDAEPRRKGALKLDCSALKIIQKL